jgi:hypothetical protein
VVDPLACDGRLQIAGLHISPPGQLRHQGYPNTQPLPPLMFKQTALDFGQGRIGGIAGFYCRRCQPETAYL